MWDLKPDRPGGDPRRVQPDQDQRAGMEICELFPKLAKMADKFAIIRSLSDSAGDHSAYQCMTGHVRGREQPPPGGWPSFGSWLSKLQGETPTHGVPPNISLMYRCGNLVGGDSGDGGFLGLGHSPFKVVDREATEQRKTESMTLQELHWTVCTTEILSVCRSTRFHREADTAGSMKGLDALLRRRWGILTSSKLADALDLSLEDPKVLAKYGVDDPVFERDGAPRMVRNFCIARRLVEAGARCISMNFIRWDWHGRRRHELHQQQAGLSAARYRALFAAARFARRGLDKDVSVVVWGEFGPHPAPQRQQQPRPLAAGERRGHRRWRDEAGAGHWPDEQVRGSPVDRPVKFQEVFATLYAKAGLNLNNPRIRPPRPSAIPR